MVLYIRIIWGKKYVYMYLNLYVIMISMLVWDSDINNNSNNDDIYDDYDSNNENCLMMLRIV